MVPIVEPDQSLLLIFASWKRLVETIDIIFGDPYLSGALQNVNYTLSNWNTWLASIRL